MIIVIEKAYGLENTKTGKKQRESNTKRERRRRTIIYCRINNLKKKVICKRISNEKYVSLVMMNEIILQKCF